MTEARKLHLLRTMNPNVVTKDGAELCKWAADEIERLQADLQNYRIAVANYQLSYTEQQKRIGELERGPF